MRRCPTGGRWANHNVEVRRKTPADVVEITGERPDTKLDPYPAAEK